MWFFSKSKKKVNTEIEDDENDDTPRYPPFAEGLPAKATERVLRTQKDLIGKIKGTLRFNNDEFYQYVYPTIERYARYTHLLPASEHHHHRGAGGLFRHGLEVGFWAARRGESHQFCFGDTPRDRQKNEPKWQLALFFGGLVHDIGKPLSDVCVTDRSGKREWNAYDKSILQWCEDEELDRYFIRWRGHRHKRHERYTMMLIGEIITKDAKAFLNSGGREIFDALTGSLLGTSASEEFTKIVLWADGESVKRDTVNKRLDIDEYSYSVPVERFIFDSLRQIVKATTINKPGAFVWRTEEGVFLVWERAVREILSITDKNKIPGIPRNPESLADVLIEKGFATCYFNQGMSARYWTLYPECLKGVPLRCLRIDDVEIIFTNEPPATVRASFDSPVTDQLESVAESTGAVDSGQPESSSSESNNPIDDALEQHSPDTHDSRTQAAPSSKPTPPRLSDSAVRGSKESLGWETEIIDDVEFDKATGEVLSEKPKTLEKLFVPAGDAWGLVVQAVERLKKNEAVLQKMKDGSFAIPHPAATRKYGEPKEVMDTLSDAGLIKCDPTTTLKVTKHGDQKFLVLNDQVNKVITQALEDGAAIEQKPGISSPTEGKEEQPKPQATPQRPLFKNKEFGQDLLRQLKARSGKYIVGDPVVEEMDGYDLISMDPKTFENICSAFPNKPVTAVKIAMSEIKGLKIKTQNHERFVVELQHGIELGVAS